MLVKELWRGDERAYACKISRRLFGEHECGSREAARRAALHHACEIIREQRRCGVPASASIRERRRIYRAQLAHPSSGASVSNRLEIIQ